MSAPSIAFTRFDSVSDTVGSRHDLAWDALCASIATAPPRAMKTDLPLVKLGVFGDRPNAKGGLRHEENLLAVSGVEGDYDLGQVTLAQAADRLTAAGVEAVLYTTPSHRPEAPRWRVLAPLSRPHEPQERRRLVAALNSALGGVLAGESFTLAQMFYVGQVAGAQFECRRVHGQPLDKVALPEVYPPTDRERPEGEPDAAVRAAAIAAVTDETMSDLGSALAALHVDRLRTYADGWSTVALALASLKGTPFEARAHALLHEASRRVPEKYDERAVDRAWGPMQPDRVSFLSIFKMASADGWQNPRAAVAVTPDAEGFVDVAAEQDTDAKPPRIVLTPITLEEAQSARIAPREILPGLLYADLRLRIAAGGVGKTTLLLHEAACLAMCRELYGRTPLLPVRTVIVTREDPREILVARLWKILAAMDASTSERADVLRNM